jgi:hypothetical protein
MYSFLLVVIDLLYDTTLWTDNMGNMVGVATCFLPVVDNLAVSV